MPKKEPLYPHVPKSRKQSSVTKPTREDVEVDSWSERDRLGIWIVDLRTDKTIAEWWDNEARQMFEDGFFKPAAWIKGQTLWGAEFRDSVLDYAEETGILAKRSSVVGSEYKEAPTARLKELEAEALELQRKIRAKYPMIVPEPWPEELNRWQGRLWQLGYEIVREQERLKT